MASRGSVARNGHILDNEYKIVDVLEHGEKILEGVEPKFHTLPDYSHSPNAVYVLRSKKEKNTIHSMRIYGSDHRPILEFAFHPEPILNHKNRKENVWHMHIYKPNLDREPARYLTEEVKRRYREYLEDIGYDQW